MYIRQTSIALSLLWKSLIDATNDGVVADVPNGEPEIMTDKVRYASGEHIQVNCTAPPSLPAANLTWYLNDHEVWPLAFFEVTQLYQLGEKNNNYNNLCL